jgi:hypothetical protein
MAAAFALFAQTCCTHARLTVVMSQPQPHVAVRVLLALAASNSWLAMGGPWVHHGAKTLCAASIHPYTLGSTIALLGG